MYNKNAKIFSLCFLLVYLFGIISTSFAASELNSISSKYIGDLNKFENTIDNFLDVNIKKSIDEEIDKQLQDTKIEIDEYLKEIDNQLKTITDSKKASALSLKAKKVVILKTLDGSVKKHNLSNFIGNIESDISGLEGLGNDLNLEEINKAVSTLQDSLLDDGNYRIFIKSNIPSNKIKSKLSTFGTGIKIGDIIDGKINDFIEVIIPKDTLLGDEILDVINDGKIPNSILGMEIVSPTLFKADAAYLDGESVDYLWGMKRIGADKYQKTLQSATKVKVAVLDTGIDVNHVDLKDKIDKSLTKDFSNSPSGVKDVHGHGTHVSGTIGASVNGEGVYGVNSNVSIVGLKVLNDEGQGSSYDIYNAIKYAADNNIKVLNLSLGGDGNPSNDALCEAIDYALGKGTISVVAAGNENQDVAKKVPGGCRNAITVGAIDSYDKKADFSNFGSEVDVAAPGVGIYSSLPNNSYDSRNGTSMATPHVAGMVSAIFAYKNTLSLSELKTIIANNSVSVSGNIGKIVSMDSVMKSLGVKADDASQPVTPAPVDGVCGSSNGGEFTAKPTTNLCSKGTASSVSGTGPWNWTCSGENNGVTAKCSATKKAEQPVTPAPVDGVCGSSNGGEFTAKPTTNLCSKGTASSVSGTGPWNWTCSGENNGVTAKCSATIKAETPPSTGTCQTGTHKEGTTCVSDVLPCSISNGVGEKKWNGLFWSMCEVKSCNSGYEDWGSTCQKSW